MKKLGKVLAGVVVALCLLVLLAIITGNSYLLKGLRASYLHGTNSASIDDAQFFKTNPIPAAGPVNQSWPVHTDYNKATLSDRLQAVLKQTESVALLVVQNDSILNEHYWDSYSDTSHSNSFSMAKSITTLLAQIAIQKGVLKGWDQKVKTLLPGLKGPYAGELELWHLSTMSSGLDWDEAYTNPFCVTAKAYYDSDIDKLMMGLPIKDKPGKFFNYQSGSTQLLGMCLVKATGKTLSQLASEWLWQPLQAENDAYWHTDDKGMEMAFCCFNSNARDFARFGKLMLHQGNWNGNQVLDSSFVKMATAPALAPYYGYSFWLYNSGGTRVFFQWGILGQYIISIPEYNAVIVRLGHHSLNTVNDDHTEDLAVIVEEVIKQLKARAQK
jgi:CubicO group peptidase (beta-lactamase class C family)